ncbi:MAG: VCBS repeat-containing protein [Sedimentisphaerales bacterium]|nr:VCBS repeat-containing protein [Sedimentisphaerales bacterium]
MKRAIMLAMVIAVSLAAGALYAQGLRLRLGPEQIVDANGIQIEIPGYSVPSFEDWNNDGLKDLIVGEGKSLVPGKVRIYINDGNQTEPHFDAYFYAQSEGEDLACTPSGCLGCFPRVVYWDADARKDLLVGQADGKIQIFLNNATDENPAFYAGTFLQVGQPGAKTNIDVGDRATPTVVDWNNDGLRDLIVGSRYGQIYLYINEGTDTAPDYRTTAFVRQNGANLDVPADRSSPVVMDLDGDGKKDILTGNTNGQIFFYTNTGTDADPNFAGYVPVTADGTAIDLAGTPRSRPFVCDWNGDGYPDLLVGAMVNLTTGFVHLYKSIPQPGDLDKDYDVDSADFALFALYFGFEACGPCNGADLTEDTAVDMRDLLEFSNLYLEGVD